MLYWKGHELMSSAKLGAVESGILHLSRLDDVSSRSAFVMSFIVGILDVPKTDHQPTLKLEHAGASFAVWRYACPHPLAIEIG
jgi:hypothetical protein